MTKAISIIAAMGLVAQAAFFVGFGFLAADLLSLTYTIAPEMREGSLVPFVEETIASYRAILWTGLISAAVHSVIYVRRLVRAPWFLAGTRVLAWLWLLLLPIGAVVAIVLIT